MKCPKCGIDDDKVLDSRSAREGAAIRRRRECLKCSYRFTTYEEIDRDEVLVVKRDGTRQTFERGKVEKAIRHACGKRPVSEAIITSGGIKVSEIDPKTMASKLVEGLYFAGEIIDCDAYTGGFNLQVAWATAYAAGMAVAE